MHARLHIWLPVLAALIMSAVGAAELPAESPEAVWRKFRAAVEAGDFATAKFFCHGAMAEEIGHYETLAKKKPDRALSEATDSLKRYAYQGEEVEAEPPAGRLVFTAYAREYIIECALIDGEWKLSKKDSRDRTLPYTVAEQNLVNFKNLQLPLLMYAGDNTGELPPNLDALLEKKLVKSADAYTWVDPDSGEKTPVIYIPSLRDDAPNAPATVMAISPGRFDGRYLILFLDGHMESMPDDRAMKILEPQGLRLPTETD